MVRVVRIRNIFRDPSRGCAPHYVEWRQGQRVRDYLPADFDCDGGHYVALNRVPLLGTQVDTLEPQDGDQIECGNVPGIVAALVPGLATAAAGIKLAVAVADFILISAISIGLSYGIAALSAPPKTPHYSKEDGPSRSWDGIQDTAGNGRPVPFLYGQVRCGGQFLQSFERLPAGEEASTGVTTLYTLLGIGIGPLESISDIQINGQELATINAGAEAGEEPIQYWSRLGTADQALIPSFGGETVHEIVHARAIRYDDEQPQHFTTTDDVDAFEVTFRFPSGLYKSTLSGQGSYTAEFRVEWRSFGTGEDWSSSNLFVKTISANTRSPYKDQIRVDDLLRGKYEIRITRLTEDDEEASTAKKNVVSVSEVYAISEIQYEAYAHPGLALVGFKQIPSPQLNAAVPTTYTFLVKGFNDIRIYTTETNYTTDYSENPAWCCAHFLTHPIVGMGDRYDYSNIDLPSFLEWAAYCDEMVSDGQGGLEKRCTFGHVFDEFLPAQDVLDVFTQGTGATLVLWGDRWRVVLDEPSEMVWIGNEANIKPGTFRQEWIPSKERANRIHGVFSDRENDYQRDSTQVELPDLGQGDLYVDASREFFGVTRRSQVERELTRLLMHNKYADEKVSFTAGLDALRVTVGSVFGVCMPCMGVGLASGKILAAASVSASTFTIDEWVTLEAGKTYEVYVQHRAGGSIDHKRVISNPGLTRDLAVEDGVWTNSLQVGDVYSLGVTAIMRFRCIEAKLNSAFERDIVGMRYDDLIYTYDLTSPPTGVLPSIPDPRALPPDPEGLVLFERQEFSHDGSLIDVIDVDWSAPISAALSHYEVWWREAGEVGWILGGTTSTTHFELKPAQAPDYTYEVAAVSVSTTGVKRNPEHVQSRFLTTTGLLTQPPNLSGLQAYIISGTLVATVDALDPEDLGPAGYYEWRRGSTWEQSVLLDRTKSPRLEMRSYARGTTTILAKAVNSVGNQSPTAASVSIALYGEIDENVILEQDEHTAWTGTKVGLQLVSGKLTLYEPNVTTVFVPMRPMPTRGARFLSFGYPDATQKVVLTGYYTTAPITVSGGDLVRARADVAVSFSPIAIGLGTFEDADFSFDSAEAQIAFSGDEPESVQVVVQSRVSTTTTEETAWTAWTEHRDRAERDMKYIQFRLMVTVASDAYSIEISAMTITIDLPEKYFAGYHAQLSATSFTVNYPTDYFVSVARLLVSVIGGAVGDTPRVTAQDETGFTAEIRDSGGSLTTGTLHYEALGY